MLKRLKNILLYAGVEESVYKAVSDEIAESSRKNLRVFSLLAFLFLSGMYAASFFVESLEKNRPAYIFSTVVMLLLLILSGIPAKKHPGMIYPLVYVFVGVLLAFGIMLGTFIEPEEITASYIILLFAIPLLFTDRPYRMGSVILISIFVYCAAAKMTQPERIFGYNMTNVVPYGTLSIVVSGYMMNIKVLRFALEQQNRFLSESDQLTGLLNRRSFEQHLSLLRKKGFTEELKICAFDVNGLKKVNDSLGHKAGDELIRGAADCISGVFGQYGICYRVGGDEFMAILEGAAPTSEELKEMLEKRASSWKGMIVSGMSVSLGIAKAEPGSTIDEMVNQADKMMYANKAAFYRRSGNDRRQR